ncbi:hypothetical protein FRAAL2518 [Frankia alni ACN14a]|uniref:Uncharacterized protein n=1 Tax=Frankia alni (strain DSM 45986 / CECT 9034 / ACN14a) TaxID=326424 RepID=Q0RAM0_FRAAA|nr:hypothetical protein FRAAL2518 [Frankia alni ACN14a]
MPSPHPAPCRMTVRCQAIDHLWVVTYAYPPALRTAESTIDLSWGGIPVPAMSRSLIERAGRPAGGSRRAVPPALPAEWAG